MFRRSPQARQGDAGFTLLETLLALAIGAIVIMGSIYYLNERVQEIRDQGTSEHLNVFAQAANSYIQDNYATLQSGGPAIVTPTISPAFAAYLPPNWGSDAYGENYVLVVNPGATSLDAFVDVGDPTRVIEPAHLRNIAALSDKVGQSGVFYNPANTYTYPTFNGMYGGFTTNVTGFPASGIAKHTLGVFIHLQNSDVYANYLYRVAIPGHPELNRMQTNLDMSTYNILMNGGSIGTSASRAGTLYSSNIDNAGSITNGGDINNNGNINNQGSITSQGTLTVGGDATLNANVFAPNGQVYATDFDLTANGGQKVSQGIYFAGIVADNTTITKPTCPTGETAQVFAMPVNFVDANGHQISGVTANALDLGASWVVRLTLITPQSTYNPAPAFGSMAVMTKCS